MHTYAIIETNSGFVWWSGRLAEGVLYFYDGED